MKLLRIATLLGPLASLFFVDVIILTVFESGFMKECRTLYSFNGSAPMTTTTAKTMKDDS
jgi:hypothetical protein